METYRSYIFNNLLRESIARNQDTNGALLVHHRIFLTHSLSQIIPFSVSQHPQISLSIFSTPNTVG